MGTGIHYFFPGFILHGGAPQRQRQCGLNERDQAGIALLSGQSAHAFFGILERRAD